MGKSVPIVFPYFDRIKYFTEPGSIRCEGLICGCRAAKTCDLGREGLLWLTHCRASARGEVQRNADIE